MKVWPKFLKITSRESSHHLLPVFHFSVVARSFGIGRQTGRVQVFSSCMCIGMCADLHQIAWDGMARCRVGCEEGGCWWWTDISIIPIVVPSFLWQGRIETEQLVPIVENKLPCASSLSFEPRWRIYLRRTRCGRENLTCLSAVSARKGQSQVISETRSPFLMWYRWVRYFLQLTRHGVRLTDYIFSFSWHFYF